MMILSDRSSVWSMDSGDAPTPREAGAKGMGDGVSGAPASIPRIPTAWDSPSCFCAAKQGVGIVRPLRGGEATAMGILARLPQ